MAQGCPRKLPPTFNPVCSLESHLRPPKSDRKQRKRFQRQDAKVRRTILKGLRPSVARNELPWVGRRKRILTPTGLCPESCAGQGNGLATTPLGLDASVGREPKVAPAAQPWAGGRNPVGILRDDRRGGIDEIHMAAHQLGECVVGVEVTRLKLPKPRTTRNTRNGSGFS